MKIAQISPLFESVPPKTYGGTERVVHYLTEELVNQGHDVTLYASGDSVTNANLRSIIPEALRLSTTQREPAAWHTLQLADVAKHCDQYDIVHFHTDFLHFPLWRCMRTPQLSTLHGRLDLPDLHPVYNEFSDMQVVSISNSQRNPMLQACWAGTVYNGIPENLYDYQSTPGEYLAFLGRISPEKGIIDAIQIAIKIGMPLKIAAKVDPVDQHYFDQLIEPMLHHPLIEYIGEVDEAGKNELLGGAYATLLPINWPEPFGLVMIESFACGTPVVAYRRGSVPEVMVDQKTGFVVNNQEEAIAAIKKIDLIKRSDCRMHFEANFTSHRMADDYLYIYSALTKSIQANRSQQLAIG